ncbi:radical SAM protein [Paenibacillus sambharensis]|uniref:Radical SAM protein n=1 Tax=Paenibacillus sambharensis TaxID=1803190 RepID=A0A2W1LNJ7_9BACL|nr:radical SAM protein [Paenibacillus sambharensis]PZD96054.1 radical SAM protein [Paenibacillus sambharensis]
MLLFYPQFTRTFHDLPGHTSLLIHAWNGCNMRCFGCHNYDELIAGKPVNPLTPHNVAERLKSADQLMDAVLFSGGEFLINPLEDIEQFLRAVRDVFRGVIVLLTNGSYPRKLERLLADGLADGVHIDMKLPYHCLDPAEDSAIYQAVIGTVPSVRFRDDMLQSIELVIRHNSPYSRIRTVQYPILSPEFFEHIREYVVSLNARHHSSVPYDLNPYHQPLP